MVIKTKVAGPEPLQAGIIITPVQEVQAEVRGVAPDTVQTLQVAVVITITVGELLLGFVSNP